VSGGYRLDRVEQEAGVLEGLAEAAAEAFLFEVVRVLLSQAYVADEVQDAVAQVLQALVVVADEDLGLPSLRRFS